MEKTKKRSVMSTVLTVIAIILALLCVCKIFFIDVYTVTGTSMTPTYADGQKVFARKAGPTNRFNTVVITADKYVEIAGLGDQNIKRLFKRAVAIGGDEVWSENGVLCIKYSNGEEHKLTDESYNGNALSKIPVDFGKRKVPDGYIFVMGDNRVDSVDSRVFGFVSLSDVEAVTLS